jgi:DNA-binding response OmpR family regulator
MAAPFRVALLGFSPFERNTLASCFRLATHRSPSYTLVQMMAEPDFLVADADHGPSVQLALAEEMLALTVFIGSEAPAGATAWMQRPIDPLHVMRELDAMVSLLLARHEAQVQAVHDNPPRGAPAAADEAEPPTRTPHGQRTLLLPRRERRHSFIEEAFVDTPASAGQAALPLQAEAPAEVPAEIPAEVPSDRAPSSAEAPGPAPPAHSPWPPAADDAATLAFPPRHEPAPAALPPPCALLVDDSELARHFLARLLEPWGVVCDQSPTSHQALQRLEQRDYDFIFLDMELGEGSAQDGLALCQQIKRRHTHMHAALATVVMVSAHHSESDRVRGTLAGCDAYLGKPLKLDELHALLQRQGLKAPGVAPRRRAPGGTSRPVPL